jgi:hypothetical protein
MTMAAEPRAHTATSLLMGEQDCFDYHVHSRRTRQELRAVDGVNIRQAGMRQASLDRRMSQLEEVLMFDRHKMASHAGKGVILATIAALAVTTSLAPAAASSARHYRHHYYHGNGRAAAAFMGAAVGIIGGAIAAQQRREYYENYGYYGGPGYGYYGRPYYGPGYYDPY